MWIFLALGASVFWGITYALDEQILRKISVPTSLAIGSIVAAIAMSAVAFFTGNLKTDIHTMASSRKVLMLVLAGTVTFVIAEFFISFSIQAKNASLAGLIEISYPIFIALFSLLVFKESHLNTASIIGGILIFVGVGVIYFFNK